MEVLTEGRPKEAVFELQDLVGQELHGYNHPLSESELIFFSSPYRGDALRAPVYQLIYE